MGQRDGGSAVSANWVPHCTQIKFCMKELLDAVCFSVPCATYLAPQRVRTRSFVRGKYLGKAPDFVKGVVKRSWRDADHVRLAKIAFHTSGDKFFV